MSSRERRHYVQFLIGENDSVCKEIVERKVTELPKGAVGYRFFDGDPDDKENLSGWYYKGERVSMAQINELLEDMKNWPGNESGKEYHRKQLKEILSKMQDHDAYYVCTSDKKVIRLHEGDTVFI